MTGEASTNPTRNPSLKTIITGIKEVTTKVTLPEGKNMLEFFALIEKAKIAKASELEALARDKEFLAHFTITGDTAEGHLFPDTYEFRVNEKPRAVLEKLIAEHEKANIAFQAAITD